LLPWEDEDCYVSRVRASNFREGTAYVTKNGYKLDEFRPFVYKTEDFGATWISLNANLPNEPVNVIFEDAKNPDLLFIGNDTGIFVSIDGGKSWVKMNNNIPNVPVHDLVVHPRENDLVVATYGRGIFVTNISPLQEVNERLLDEDVHLFKVKPTAQRVSRLFGANDYLYGDSHVITPNEPNGVAIHYYLKKKVVGEAKFTIANFHGQELATFKGETDAGLHRIFWDMRRPVQGQTEPFWMRRLVLPHEQWLPPGDYVVTLEIGSKKLSQKIPITKTIGWSLGPCTEVIR